MNRPRKIPKPVTQQQIQRIPGRKPRVEARDKAETMAPAPGADISSPNPPVSSDLAMTAKWQQWHQTWGKWVKIGGVCLVLFGVFTVVTALL